MVFSKKPAASIDYDALITPELLDFLGKLEELELQFNKVERYIEIKSLEWNTQVSEFKRKVYKARKEVGILKNNSFMLKKHFLILIRNFKLKATNDNFRKIKSLIENKEFENLISNEEFKRLLN